MQIYIAFLIQQMFFIYFLQKFIALFKESHQDFIEASDACQQAHN